MANVASLHLDPSKVPQVSGMGSAVAVLVSAWLALVLVFASRGAFVAPPGAPPLGLLIGLTAPLSLFLGGYWISRSFREFVLSIDLAPDCGDSGVEVGWFRFPYLVHLSDFAGTFRVDCRTWRYGDRNHSTLRAAGSRPQARVRDRDKLSRVESLRHPGSRGGREYRSRHSNLRAESIRGCYDVADVATSVAVDSSFPSADVLDSSFDCIVPGAPIERWMTWWGAAVAGRSSIFRIIFRGCFRPSGPQKFLRSTD